MKNLPESASSEISSRRQFLWSLLQLTSLGTLLSSCSSRTLEMLQAAQIQAPHGMRVVQPGTPIPYNQVPHTQIAKPQPHPYPQHARNLHTSPYTPEQIKMMNFYGGLYDDPKEALAPWPAYARNYHH